MEQQSRRFRRAHERRLLKSMMRSDIREQLGATSDFTDSIAPQPPSGESTATGFRPLGEKVFNVFAKTEDVATIFQVHPKTVERWRKRHGLPCVVAGGTVRYDLSDVLRWASARKEGV